MKSEYIRGNRGFSLVELIVVLAVMGILTAIVVPNYFNYLANKRLEAAALQMASDIRYTEQLAMAEESISYFVIFYADNKYSLRKSLSVKKSVELPTDIDLACTNFTNSTVRIGATGIPTVGGTITLYNKKINKSKYVVVAPITGRVRVSDISPGLGM